MADECFPDFGDRYRVKKLLGRGGMAEVYQAIDTTLDRVVAIKSMLPVLAADEEFRRRFKLEAKAAGRMASPYVVGIHDWGELDGRCFIVMEYLRGADLREALRINGPIHPVKLAEMASQVCSALIEAQRHGIVHRDIKPANIMVLTTGDVKVMDFGIARAGDVTTNAQGAMGTVPYMSPEQLRGEPATFQSDLYSLGASMYQLGTGILPRDARLPRYEEAGIIPPCQLNGAVDERLSDIVMKAMQPDPRLRYPTASEMKSALEEYLASPDAGEVAASFPAFWAVVFVEGAADQRGSVVAFDQPTVLGRSANAGIAIHDGAVSSEHVLLTPRGQYLEVEDMASINGTFVDGVRASRKLLCAQGATIALGSTRLLVGRG